MAIAFNSIPFDIRTPGQYIEFDSSRAVQGTPVKPHKALLIGQRLAAGTVVAGVPMRISSAGAAEGYFGRGSYLAAMARAFKAANRYTELWAVALDDEAAGAAATGTIAPTGPATAAGTLYLYVGGKRVVVGITSGMTRDQIAAAVTAAVNADTTLPLTAATTGVAGSQLTTLTARHKGTKGNAIDVRVNYRQGEVLPAGVSLTVAAMSGGATDPSVQAALTAIGDVQYDTIAVDFNDDANLDLVEAEALERWGPMVQKEGHAFAALGGTLSQLSTAGNVRNSPFSTLMGTGGSPTPFWEWAAVVAAVDAGEPDPARPRQTLLLPGVLPPALASRFTREERNALLWDGVSTFVVDGTDNCYVERLITTYQTNALGVADPTFLDITTPRNLAYLRYSQRTRIAFKYPRHKLADDGTQFAPGQAIVTPSVIRAELIALAREWELDGHIEDVETFKQELIVERNATDRNRLDVRTSPDLINGLIVLAGQVQFGV